MRRIVTGTALGALLASSLTAAALLPAGVAAAVPGPPGPNAVGATPVELSQPSDPDLGRVAPAPDADTRGMFGAQVRWPLIPVHAVLMPNGHLVTYGTPLGQAAQGGLSYDDWNPARGAGTGSHVQTPSMPTYNSFCNGMQRLPDGRVLMVGGNSTMSTMLFDPATQQETTGAALTDDRWYATALRRPDDQVLVLGGADSYNTGAYTTPDNDTGVATVPEIGNGTGAWTQLTGARSSVAFGARDNRWWYPRAYNAPDGSVFGISADQMWRMTTTGAGAIAALGTLPASIGVSGSSVMYAPGKLLLAGGGQQMNTDQVTATNAATVVDINAAVPVVTPVAPMAARRNWLNLTALPTGEVLANGGTVAGTNAGAANSAYQAELWNPTTRQWRPAATAQRIRTYHSVSVLLPSGAVLTGGGGVPGPEDNLNTETYYPPYLFTRNAAGAVVWADRARITTLAGSATHGGTLTLGMSDARAISSVSLINLGSVTHSYDVDQRRIPVAFTQAGQSVRAVLPTSVDAMPPGSYLLQAVDGRGVPTPSQIVTVNRTGVGTVTVYEPTRATGGGQTGTGTAAGVVPLAAGSVVGLEPFALWGYRVRHQGFQGRVDPIGGADPVLARQDSSFAVRAGLASATDVSFEAVGFPGYYLRSKDGKVTVQKGDGTAVFAGDATFLPVAGLSGQFTSFKLFSNQATYLRHKDYLLRTDPFDGTDVARTDMTWAPRPGTYPVVVGARVRLEASTQPDQLVRHQGYLAKLSRITAASPALDLADATFVAVKALNGSAGISLEATNFPGWYLRQQADNTVRLQQGDGTPAFAATASWAPTVGLTGTGMTLRTAADGVVTLAYAGATTVLTSAFTGADAGRDAATFTVRNP